jgi:hypothetical protein
MLFFTMPVAVESGVDVGSLVAKCVADLEMTHKDAWVTCGYGDGAQWHRALKGEAPLDLWKLRHLSIKFWQLLLPRLASALIQQFFSDLSVPYRMARADIERHEQKRSA